jgi:hypothetical protein
MWEANSWLVGRELRRSRQGRNHQVAGNLDVKEIVIDGAAMRERLVICRDSDQAVRDTTTRKNLLAELTSRPSLAATPAPLTPGSPAPQVSPPGCAGSCAPPTPP